MGGGRAWRDGGVAGYPAVKEYCTSVGVGGLGTLKSTPSTILSGAGGQKELLRGAGEVWGEPRSAREGKQAMRFELVALVALSAALVLVGFQASLSALELEARVVTIEVKGVNHALKILHLTDLHLRGIGLKELKVLRLSKELEPDLVVLTGDYVESREGLRYLELFLRELRRSLPSTPIAAVLGNWDYKTGLARDIEDLMKTFNITLLKNTMILTEVKGQKLVIVGLDDMIWGKPDLSIVLKACGTGLPVLVLAHEPALALKALEACPHAVALAGHCHCGQVSPLGRPLLLPRGCPLWAYKGVVRVSTSTLAVSCGVGESLLPLRVGSKPEVLVVVLKGPS